MSKPKGARLNGFAVTQGDVNELLTMQRQLIWAGFPVAIWITDWHIVVDVTGAPQMQATSIAELRTLIHGALWAAKAVKR